ncbi:MAG TPA: aldose epimerase family protein [Draconibacterium sp.]|nr:aldose epimerase family protein [Draconibacterium sp.]
MKKVIFIAVTFLISSVTLGQTPETIKKELLGEHNGSDIYLFTLTNKEGNVLRLTNYGAKIVGIEVPDRNGNRKNITTGSVELQNILRDAFGGATIGRFANRIANAKFTLDGVEYNLPKNNGPNTSHGGPNGWFSKVWDFEMTENIKDPSVKFTIVSPDMDEGFPGEVTASVNFTWNDNNEVIIDYLATTDKKTVINLTNHVYFNLHGARNGYIYDHILTINASNYTPMDETLIPLGNIRPVKGTPLDFTSPHQIGYKIGETFEGEVFRGYDDNFVLDKNAEVAVTVYDSESGRVLEMMTDQPGMQMYTQGRGMAWKESVESGEKSTNVRSALALETQHYPNSPNQPEFPSTVLSPGEPFKSQTIYRFSVKEE